MLKWMNMRLMEGEGDGNGGGGGAGDTGNGGNGGDAGGGNGEGGKTILSSAGAGDQEGDKGAAGAGEDGKWLWGEDVPGTGTVPPWLKTEKFKTVAEQAKALPALEEKIGPAAELIGAPEGDYEVPKLPEGTEGEWDLDDAMFKAFNSTAKEMGLSQVAYDKIVQSMGMLLATEQTEAEAKVSDALAALGTNSPERIAAVETYMQSIVDTEHWKALDTAVGNNVQAYLALEAVVAKASSDAQLSSLPGKRGLGFTREDLEKEQYKLYPEGHNLAGKSVYEHDKEHRAKVDGMWKELVPGEDIKEVG
jgi:hypothetical protein